LLRESLKKILERKGTFYCETAEDYETARKCIENLSFDLILVDIVLPTMNGIQVIKNLQQDYDIKAAIIFITGEPNLKTCIEAIRVGATDYLQKPVSRKEIINAIKRSLNIMRRRLQIIEDQDKEPVRIDKSFFDSSNTGISNGNKQSLKESLKNIHKALLHLKQEYGEDFNDDQRTSLNIIAKNNSKMRKILKSLD
jgi:DNA-binding NtrC family response regulator